MPLPTLKRRGVARQSGKRKGDHAGDVRPDGWRRRGATWAVLFCATLVAYFPALRGGMLWDDDRHVTAPALQSLQGLSRIWSDLGATQQYYPLLHSAFWLEHRLWGDAVIGYHLTNIVLHSIAAWLVVMIARRLSLSGALLAGFVFALHPVNVEAVAWIAEQKSTLSGVFYLASALTYLHFDETRRRSTYILATLLFVVALLTKTVTATLPAALLVVLWWRRGRLDAARDVQPLLPWLVCGAAAGLFTAWVESTMIGAQGADFALTWTERALLAGRVIWFYAATLVWPARLVFLYPRWQVDAGVWWQYLFPAGVVAVAVGFWIVVKRTRAPLAGFLFFTGTLFPVLGFLNVYPFRFSYVADHFQYLASLGVIVPVASVSVSASALRRSRPRIPEVVGAAALVVLGLLTWRQSAMYRDAETLYRTTLMRNPESWLAHNNLGVVLAPMPGRLQDAIAEYQAALRLNPDLPEAHNDLGTALARVPGRDAEAAAEFEAALRLKPDFAEAHFNLAEMHFNQGNALSQMPGRLPDAVAEFEAALRAKPAFAGAHNNLGNALALMPGRRADAIAEYRAALRAEPDYAEAHFNLGSALSQEPGRLSEAIAEYQAALRLQPDYAKAHNNLGNALTLLPGRTSEAIAEYRVALRLKPDYAEAHYNLGNALAGSAGRMADAVVEYREALRIKPDLAQAREALRLTDGYGRRAAGATRE
jgi:tetratricopeptide (TPR) repeat protein